MYVHLHRDVSPSHGFVLLNRLSSDNLQEIVGAGSEYRVQGVFVLFKKHSGTKSYTVHSTEVHHIVHYVHVYMADYYKTVFLYIGIYGLCFNDESTSASTGEYLRE